MLYQMLTKRLPFGGRTLSETARPGQQRVPSPPRTIDDKIPKPLEDVCLKAMAKNPADRFSTAAEWPPHCGPPWPGPRLRGVDCGSPAAWRRCGRFRDRCHDHFVDLNKAQIVQWTTRHSLTRGISEPIAPAHSARITIPFEPTWPKLEIDYQDRKGTKSDLPTKARARTIVLHEGDKVSFSSRWAFPATSISSVTMSKESRLVVWPLDSSKSPVEDGQGRLAAGR